MRYLLDTHSFLWLASDDARLSVRAKEAFLSPENDFLLSVASIWEVAIKASLGRLKFVLPLPQFVERQVQHMGLEILPISVHHATAVEGLPFHHRDPFDRLLIAQSMYEAIPILGTDEIFDTYGIARVW